LKKGIKILYYITVVISALVGVWHFFVPWMFQWYDYLPMQYENLIVGIDYTNYCFSLLLFGLSTMLIVLGKRALARNREIIYFYFFLTVVWIFRACLASFIEPWPLQPIPAAAIGQLIASDILAVMMIIVSASFIKELRRK
jgi:magnesium-transporting ATPase (P-type)